MLNAVCLASGGLDSLVCMALLRGMRIGFIPVFVDYGQRNAQKELSCLREACDRSGLSPRVVNVAGFGAAVRSGITDSALRVKEDAFTPNRNLLFLLLGASVAYQYGLSNVVLGLLSEKTAIFPDQTERFIIDAQAAIRSSLCVEMEVILPLRHLTKADVVLLSRELGVSRHYSCHAGGDAPCGTCIACLEYGG